MGQITKSLKISDIPLVALGNDIHATAVSLNVDESDGSNVVAYSEGNLEYAPSVDETYYIVTGIGDYSNSKLIIPSEHSSGLPIKEIAAGAFEGNKNITRVTIPESIARIGSKAFGDCSYLTSVSFDGSNDFINMYFHNSMGLTNVRYYWWTVTGHNNGTFPGQIMSSRGSVADYEGGYPHSLWAMSVPKDAVGLILSGYDETGKLVQSGEIPSDEFVHCKCWEMHYEQLNLITQELVSPAVRDYIETCEVNSPPLVIGAGAFMRTYIKSINFPFRIKTIDSSAFQNCPYLESVTFSDVKQTLYYGFSYAQLENIGMSAFEGCSRLSFLTLPDNLKSIGITAFKGTGLVQVLIPTSVTTIGASTFHSCTALDSITLLCNCEVPSAMFMGCSNLRSINIGQRITAIGSQAFEGCLNLIKINIPKNVLKIGANAFNKCGSLSQLKFNDPCGWFAGTDASVNTYQFALDPDTLANSPQDYVTQYVAYTLYNLNKMPAPTISIDGETINITDPTGIADEFKIYVNGFHRATYDVNSNTITLK